MGSAAEGGSGPRPSTRAACVAAQQGASKLQAMTAYVEAVEPTMIQSFTEQVKNRADVGPVVRQSAPPSARSACLQDCCSAATSGLTCRPVPAQALTVLRLSCRHPRVWLTPFGRPSAGLLACCHRK